MYCSQDPIGLAGGEPNFYSYVHDSNGWVDIFGLEGIMTIVKMVGDGPSGNHYKLFYQDSKNISKVTDLIGDDITQVRNVKNTKISLDDIPDIDKKVVKVTGDIEKSIKSVKPNFNNKKYKLNDVDCFRYIEAIIKKANSSINIKGKTNLDRFNSLPDCK